VDYGGDDGGGACGLQNWVGHCGEDGGEKRVGGFGGRDIGGKVYFVVVVVIVGRRNELMEREECGEKRGCEEEGVRPCGEVSVVEKAGDGE